MNKIDLFIIIFYLIFMLIIGFVLSKNNKDEKDYFLAGRNMSWLPVMFSVAATMISANSFIGGPGWAYNKGLSPFLINITVPLAIFLSLKLILPIFYNLNLISIYDYINFRFGKSTKLIIIFGFLINSLIQVSSMIYIPALLFSNFSNLNIKFCIFVLVFVAILYTLFGGIKAVIWTDVIQMIILWGSILYIFYYLFFEKDISFSNTIYDIKNHYPKTINFSFDLSLENSFLGTLFGCGIMWFRYFAMDQAQVQRLLTCKSYSSLKRSFAISGIFMNLLYFLFLFLGICFFQLFKAHSFKSENDIMIFFIKNYLSPGIIGIIISGILASAMSSIDSLLNSMTTILTKNIYEEFYKKKASKKEILFISSTIGIFIIFIAIFAFSGTLNSILLVVGKYISYISGPICGAFLLGLFTIKTSAISCNIGMILGIILNIFFYSIFKFSWIWNPFIGCFFTFIFGYFFSFFYPNKQNSENFYKYILHYNFSTKKFISFDKYDFILIIFFIAQYLLIIFFL